jgi:selenocysteine-specific elongation factor
VNLSGLDHAEAQRGDVLTLPGIYQPSRRIDVRLTVLPEARPLRHRDRVLLYHGTAEQMVELSLLEHDELRPTEQGFGQLFLSTPLVASDGDRLVLRIPSPPETVAGGVILDVAPRRHRRREPATLASLGARQSADPSTMILLELNKDGSGRTESHLVSKLGLSADELAGRLRSLETAGAVKELGAIWLTRQQWQIVSGRILAALDGFHRTQPLRRGMPREELRSRTNIPVETFVAVLSALLKEGTVVEHAAEVALGTHRLGLSPEQERAAAALVAELELQPFSPPPLTDLIRKYALTPALLKYLVTEGRIVRLNDDTVLARSAYDEAVGRLRHHLEQHQTLTVAGARDMLGSSRRYVLPLLEWLDAQKITRRVGDDRILRD